ncbi:hypothetical protein [Burkholderia sp. PU8-34]
MSLLRQPAPVNARLLDTMIRNAKPSVAAQGDICAARERILTVLLL